jgi:hypothetical protein
MRDRAPGRVTWPRVRHVGRRFVHLHGHRLHLEVPQDHDEEHGHEEHREERRGQHAADDARADGVLAPEPAPLENASGNTPT